MPTDYNNPPWLKDGLTAKQRIAAIREYAVEIGESEIIARWEAEIAEAMVAHASSAIRQLSPAQPIDFRKDLLAAIVEISRNAQR